MVIRIYAIVCLIMLAAGACAAPLPGQSVEPFALPRMGTVTEYRWKPGHITVISFCAFWCDTWKEQSRRLARCREALSGTCVDFVTVSVDGRWSERAAGKVTGTLLLDLDSSLARRLGINRIPYTMVVDSDGVVRFASDGIVREAAVVDCVRKCMAGERICQGGTVYLTFDDFPCPQDVLWTAPANGPDEKLLNMLRANGVRATFFCVCSRLERSKGLIERAVKDGHSLQIHCWDHQSADPRIDQCARTIKDLTGVSPALYRLPGTERCLSIDGSICSAGPVVNPYDYTRTGKDELKRRIVLAVKPGSVILLHAGVTETIDILPDVIASLRKRGMGFGVLD